MKNLRVEDVFETHIGSSMKGFIYINEFLNSDTYKLLLKTKTRIKELNYKFVWTCYGIIYVRKDENSEKIIVNTDSYLDRLN